MPSRMLLWFPFLAMVALAFVAVACGDGEDEADVTPAVVASPSPPAASPAPEVQASPTSEAAPEPTAPPAAQTVEISAVPTIRFDKDTITVAAGSQVTLKFVNDESGVPHNWAAYTDSTATELIPGAITDICTGTCEEEITFTAPTEPGEYFFRCDVHPTTMTGTFVVE